jgi:hypothetical protein
MLIPISYLVAARLYHGHAAEKPLIGVAYCASGVMIISVLAAALHITAQVTDLVITGQSLNLLLALFWAEAAVFFGLAAAYRQYGFNIYLATAMACASLWQLLNYWDIGAEYYTVVFAALGMVLLIAYRLAVLERFQQKGLASAAFQCANALMSLSFVAAALLTISRLLVSRSDLARLAGNGDWHHPLQLLVGVLILLGCLGLLAAGLVRQPAWRRWYVISAITEGMLTGRFVAVVPAHSDPVRPRGVEENPNGRSVHNHRRGGDFHRRPAAQRVPGPLANPTRQDQAPRRPLPRAELEIMEDGMKCLTFCLGNLSMDLRSRPSLVSEARCSLQPSL